MYDIIRVCDSLRAFNLIFIITTWTDNKVVGYNILCLLYIHYNIHFVLSCNTILSSFISSKKHRLLREFHVCNLLKY